MEYTFELLCAVCQKESLIVFHVEPDLMEEDFFHTCECGNILRMDGHEIVFTAETEKAEEIVF